MARQRRLCEESAHVRLPWASRGEPFRAGLCEYTEGKAQGCLEGTGPGSGNRLGAGRALIASQPAAEWLPWPPRLAHPLTHFQAPRTQVMGALTILLLLSAPE